MTLTFICHPSKLLQANLLIIFVLLRTIATGQDFKIVKVNTSQYPTIRATFMATGTKGEKVTDAGPADFKIIEDNNTCDIVEVTNPKDVAIPASIVLVLDVSLSMSGERLQLAQKAAKAFIEQVPLETSEVAIASFSDDVYINCDFTQNYERLIDALQTLQPIGGTNYTKAFLKEQTGILSMANAGRNKRSIVFLTDGLSDTNSAEVISKALQQKTSVYCITLELPMPDILRDISTKTNGKYYEAVADINQLENIYSDIFQSLEVTKYGTISWRAAKDCKKSKSFHLVFRGKALNYNYVIPKDKIGSIDVDPSLLVFGNAFPGTNKSLSVDIIARNVPINLTHIFIPGKTPFHQTDSIITPFLLQPDHVKNITLTYRPYDTKMASGKLIISSKECPDKAISLLGGSDEQLRLICPKGGENLVVGTDTSIRWEGIRKDKSLSIFYRTRPEKSWMNIGEGTGLMQHWLTPNDTSKQVQVKLTPFADPSGQLYLTSTMPNQKIAVRGISFNSMGDKAVTIDRNSFIRVWDVPSGKLLTTFEGFRSTVASFCNNDKSIISFSRDEILVWSTQTAKLTERQTINNKLVFTSYPLPDGTEKLITGSITKDMANTYKIYMPGLKKTSLIFEKDFIHSAALTTDGTKALTLNSDNELKIWDIAKAKSVKSNHQPISPISIIINPNGKTALIIGPGTLTMIEMKSGNELFHIQRYSYKKFSPSGDMIIATAFDNNLTLIDSYTGKFILTLGNANFYKCLENGYKIMYYKNDSITIKDASSQKKLFQVYKPGAIDVSISADDRKLMAIMQSNVIDVYDISSKKMIYRVGDIDSDIRTAIFSDDGKNILTLMNNNAMQYWSPQGTNKVKEVVSGFFTILAPKPKVKKTINFDDQFVNESKELMVSDFIVNPTAYPLVIKSIEIINGDKQQFDLVSHPFPLHLKPHGKKAGEFRFTPKRTGAYKTWIQTCTPTDTFLTEVTGRGIEKQFETASSDINFGKLNISEQRDTVAAVIRNRGSKPLTINQINIAGPDVKQFQYLETKKSFIIAPGEWLKVKLRFAPKYRGKTSGSIQIKIQGLTNNYYINLTGEGVASKDIWIIGKTLNSTDSLPIKALVNCFDLSTGHTIKSMETNNNGKFAIRINADRNYGLMAEKQDYMSSSENVDIRDATLADTIRRNIYLINLKSGASIRMNCIFFEYAKATLLPSSKSELYRITELLTAQKNMIIELQGHTDAIGGDKSNMVLSMQRANAVRDYLIQHQISPKRLFVKAYGRSKPVSDNKTEEGRQLNRRVELKIIQN